jgi:hypothetical protein
MVPHWNSILLRVVSGANVAIIAPAPERLRNAALYRFPFSTIRIGKAIVNLGLALCSETKWPGSLSRRITACMHFLQLPPHIRLTGACRQDSHAVR